MLVIPSSMVVYPSPFSLFLDTVLVFWGNYVPYTKIVIFNFTGELIRVLEEKHGENTIYWDVRNEQGNLVVRGIYIFVMGTFSGKIAIKK